MAPTHRRVSFSIIIFKIHVRSKVKVSVSLERGVAFHALLQRTKYHVGKAQLRVKMLRVKAIKGVSRQDVNLFSTVSYKMFLFFALLSDNED